VIFLSAGSNARHDKGGTTEVSSLGVAVLPAYGAMIPFGRDVLFACFPSGGVSIMEFMP
jgi:hypothetical protein